MSVLTICPDSEPSKTQVFEDPDAISDRLGDIGVVFERWEASLPLSEESEEAEVLAAYADSVERLKRKYGFQSADVINIGPDHPDKAVLRKKFLSEHVHTDFEVRFFVGGRGLFFLHVGEHVYAVLCEQGDLISVPAHTRHWFDMGAEPELKCIRLFTTPEGWVAQYTGDKIAASFPGMEQFLASHSA